MRWRCETGQAAVEAAIVIPLVVLLLLGILSVGYGVVAQLLVAASATHGARAGAALCAERARPEAVVEGARSAALEVLATLAGPHDAAVSFDDRDLVVTSTYHYAPLLPGARTLLGDSVRLRYAARHLCV